MTLKHYHDKRDFSKTHEPKGKIAQSKHHLYIIQKHAASHLHYDFRLELNGVLKSWAVPKGPSLDPDVKRLAMHVEDHPLAYGNFEGTIPKGQYGGGTVMLWDKGIWKPLDENPEKAYQKGHLRMELEAEKLKGRWDLIRFKDEKHWFLIKYQDGFAKSEDDFDITKLDRSVKSNRTMDEIAENYDYIWSRDGQKKAKKKSPSHIVLPANLKETAFPSFIKPELATLVDKVPQGENWLHEVKLDGYRILAFKKGKEISLKSRNNKDWTDDLQLIHEKLKELPINQVILDGEVVVLDEQGKSSFQILQNSIKAHKKNVSLLYYVFDILYFDKYSLMHLSLIERKAILKSLLMNAPPDIRYNDHFLGNGGEIYKQSCNLALEGIVSKEINSTYVTKRSKDWLKIKCLKRQEFVIGGYSPPQGTRTGFGSLYLGVFNDEGGLIYTGNVGTGFTELSLKEIFEKMQKLTSATNPFKSKPPKSKTATWLKPVLVAEVEFTEWTEDGHLRHPAFKGLRMDKKAKAIHKEIETPLSEIKPSKKNNKAKSAIVLTHPDKILYSEDKITKQDLLNYYELVADRMLPFIKLRPLTLLRCPNQYTKCFYQRHFNQGTPKTLYPMKESENPEEQYLYLKDKEGLFSLVQMGVLEIHPWGSTINDLDYPDVIIIDLDPAPDIAWKQVVAAAIEIKEILLKQLKLKSFVKSTGGKGLHVVIPIRPEYDWETVKEFTHTFVQYLEKINPKNYISKMTKAKRTGKIFVDYLRNQRTATAIAVYSTRARLHAPVSVPLAWEELGSKIENNSYTLKSLPKRLEKLAEDPWKNYWEVKQSLPLDELDN